MKNPHDVILRPVLTEASYDGFADKRYVFEVHPTANKTEIKLALESIFKAHQGGQGQHPAHLGQDEAAGTYRRPHPGNQEGVCDPHQRLQEHRVL